MSSRRRFGSLLAWLVAAAAIGGCSTSRDPGDLFSPSEVGTLVVDAVLIVGEPMPQIFIRQTLAPGEAYSDSAAGVAGAAVTVWQRENEIGYVGLSSQPGRYIPASFGPGEQDPPIVRPETRYDLVVEAPDGRRATATTRTPAVFAVNDWVLLNESTLEVERILKNFAEVGDSVYEAPENQLVYLEGLLEGRFTGTGGPGRFQVGLESLDRDSPFVIEGDFLDEEDYENFERNSSSPALESTDDVLRMPWFSIFFEGRYKVRIYSVDENWWDLARSSPDLSGGGSGGFGGNAGEGFERPIFHIEGGIGLFGSGAVDSVGFFILPRE